MKIQLLDLTGTEALEACEAMPVHKVHVDDRGLSVIAVDPEKLKASLAAFEIPCTTSEVFGIEWLTIELTELTFEVLA